MQTGRWERDNPGFSITLNMSLLCSYSHPDTSHWLQTLPHYKQTISSLQHKFVLPHEENRLLLGFSMKTERFHLIFVSNTSTQKTLGSGVDGYRWLSLLQFFYRLSGNVIYNNTSHPVHAYSPLFIGLQIKKYIYIYTYTRSWLVFFLLQLQLHYWIIFLK